MDPTPSDFASALERAHRLSLEHLTGLDERPVSATASLPQLREHLSKPLNDTPIHADTVIEELARDAKDGLLGSAGGRFFAWVIGGAVPSALAADWLTSTWDQNAALYACSPAAAVVEEVAGAWLKDLLGLPDHASFALVTGCMMAHVTCLAAARHALLDRRGWDVERQGLFSAPKIRILTSAARHGTLERALRLIGLGLNQIEMIAINDRDQMNAQALEQTLRALPDALTIVVLQAGDINIGAYDDFETLIPLAHKYQAWVHVDGAFGLWAAASPAHRHLMHGAGQADSWATDGHKWLNVPYDSGYAFVAHPDAHRKAMSHIAPYIAHDKDARDEMDWNPEWSRRARGFPTYAAIRELGRTGIASMIERCCDSARLLVEGIGALPGAEVVHQGQINQGLVRFLDPSPRAVDANHNRRTDEVIAKILNHGGAFFGGTTWHGRRAMRISVCNWQTSTQHVQTSIETVRTVLEQFGV